MPDVSIGDAENYSEEAGQGEPLLLVPGLSGQGSFWSRQVEAFKGDFRVIVHDHRGAGRSTHSNIKYSVEQMADDVLRLMDALKIESAHLVGHSTGGAIGQMLALEHRPRLRSPVLSATWGGPDPYFRRLFEARKETLLTQGIEAYLRASVLVLAPPEWVSRNDAATVLAPSGPRRRTVMKNAWGRLALAAALVILAVTAAPALAQTGVTTPQTRPPSSSPSTVGPQSLSGTPSPFLTPQPFGTTSPI